MPLFDDMKTIRWFISHLDELAPLFDVPELLRNAVTLQEKWEILKRAGDLLAAVLDAYPVQDAFAAESLRHVQHELEMSGLTWEKLLALLPVLLKLSALLGGEES